jgi:hypothetical protein
MSSGSANGVGAESKFSTGAVFWAESGIAATMVAVNSA